MGEGNLIKVLREFEEIEKNGKKGSSVREEVIEVLKRVSEKGFGISVKGIVEEINRSEMRVRKIVKELWENVVFESEGNWYLVMRKLVNGKYVYWVVNVSDKINEIDVESWRKGRKRKEENLVKVM